MAVTELSAAASVDRAIEEIAGVELNPRRIGEDFEGSSGGRLGDSGRKAEASG